MTDRFLAIFISLVFVSSAGADEQFALLKVGNDTYTNVTITTVTATDIFFTYTGGMGNAKIRNLSPALREHFHFNNANASAAEKKQMQADKEYRIEGGAQVEDLWRTDFPGALAQARSQKKKVLLDFTGSDWCPWCMKMDQDVLSTSRFTDYAAKNLVLVRLDFPHDTPQSDGLRQANRELYERFKVHGYPTLILLNSSGKELWRQGGYAEGGPEAFIAHLEDSGSKKIFSFF